MANANILRDLTPVDADTGEFERLVPGMCMVFSIEIRNDSGVLTDDPQIKFFYQEPSAATATEAPTITHVSTGKYEYKYTLQEGGKPAFRWESSNVMVGASEFFLRVMHSRITKAA
jgi:hypothetical protein